MVEISATIVKELREKTQAGMMDCKKALQEANGDFENAVKWLREKGLSAAAKRAGRTASQGIIDIKFSDDGKAAAMFELNSETDFVAKNDKFKALLNQLLDQVLANKPKDIIALEQQAFIGDASKKVADMVTDIIAVIGENIVARRFALIETNNPIESYIHMNGSIGVLVEFSGALDKQVSKDIAMQIAAANPLYLDQTVVPAADLEKEKEIYKQMARNEGKPEAILDKIADGKVNKFFQENCLLEQAFVKDPDKKVKDILPSGVNVVKFYRFQLGA
jgi:elongation factor Ts